jgi:hypothetical protein
MSIQGALSRCGEGFSMAATAAGTTAKTSAVWLGKAIRTLGAILGTYAVKIAEYATRAFAFAKHHMVETVIPAALALWARLAAFARANPLVIIAGVGGIAATLVLTSLYNYCYAKPAAQN